jgi:hypothetical protein
MGSRVAAATMTRATSAAHCAATRRVTNELRCGFDVEASAAVRPQDAKVVGSGVT